MSSNELERILAALDAALAVQQRHEGMLSASELSTKSMLTVVREYVATQLKAQATHAVD